MSRIKLELPDQFRFSTSIPIRITDLNYGNHVGNDTILSLMHEARAQFLRQLDYSEMDLEGVSLIMSDVAIQFKAELFYGDKVTAYVAAQNIGRAGFDICYKLVKDDMIVALAKTGMVCFDYKKRSVVSLPATAREKLSS